MLPLMSTDDRTDVLKNLISKPITSAQLPVVTHELASVVISVSGEVHELTEIVRGTNGEGLLEQVRRMGKDIQTVLTKMQEAKEAAEKADKKADDAKQNSKFSVFLGWFSDKVLPSIVSWAILLAIGFTVAVALHVELVKAGP